MIFSGAMAVLWHPHSQSSPAVTYVTLSQEKDFERRKRRGASLRSG
jgi:hypothetical protein